MERPVYIVFAGVNGAGKSTFYHSDFWVENGLSKSMPRVNSDEILIQNGGDPASPSDQLKAGKEALRRIKNNFDNHKSFNQETTLTGKMALRTLKKAHETGYRVVLYYIGVASPDIALERIRHRVDVGGHNIDEAAVRRRYRESIKNLSLAIDRCDEAVVFDNTEHFVALARWSKGMISWIGHHFHRGIWLADAINDETLWRNG